jgi:hypothetical protein
VEGCDVTVTWPTAETRWRCSQCGNLTRFDVVRSARVKEFVHLDLSGEPRVEDSEVLSETLDEVRCRWCGSTGTIEMVPRPTATEEPEPPPPA